VKMSVRLSELPADGAVASPLWTRNCHAVDWDVAGVHRSWGVPETQLKGVMGVPSVIGDHPLGHSM
jgi:hypothetical protein